MTYDFVNLLWFLGKSFTEVQVPNLTTFRLALQVNPDQFSKKLCRSLLYLLLRDILKYSRVANLHQALPHCRLLLFDSCFDFRSHGICGLLRFFRLLARAIILGKELLRNLGSQSLVEDVERKPRQSFAVLGNEQVIEGYFVGLHAGLVSISFLFTHL